MSPEEMHIELSTNRFFDPSNQIAYWLSVGASLVDAQRFEPDYDPETQDLSEKRF